jgi:hypothetical protein
MDKELEELRDIPKPQKSEMLEKILAEQGGTESCMIRCVIGGAIGIG